MTQLRYIEICEGDTWKSVSRLFEIWLKENGLAENFGWSEGDSIELTESQRFYCFVIPDHHGEKVKFFETWAKTTDRLYGIERDRKVAFPEQPNLNADLPTEPNIEVPSWLK